ncbi:MAG: hypothetical protein PWQ10_249 [Patescibacteria group bacterium]|nr:hypothetical protein [Patescibacteria group bacterium]
MYAGTTFSRSSGKIVGVHQKIDRVARRKLNRYIPKSIVFPGIKDILHFEGKNGPDAIRYMKPVIDKPWHFIDPTKPDDRFLLEIINNHIMNLSKALRDDNKVRASFEAAWLAHAVVDGLTPAHHYPLNDKIEELWGKPRKEIIDNKTKNIIRGENKRDTLSKNWEYYGAGGVMTSHIMFEIGVATAISADKFKFSGPTTSDISYLKKNGFETQFIQSLYKINSMKMYEEFCKNGWTRLLASKTKKVLLPEIIKVVSLAWYQAINMTKVVKK